VQDATAAVRHAAVVTAASAGISGTAVVRIRHDGEVWAGRTVRWHGGDLEVDDVAASRPGRGFRLVDGTMYGVDFDGGWIVLGPPESIDPGSGMTPGDYVAAVRSDVGGASLRRITGGMTGLTTHRLDDGSTVYRGSVRAGLIATGSGVKDGRALRLFPFGYVAHDEAADPAAALDAALTVGADGIVRRLAVDWGTNASRWTYTVAYSELAATPPIAAPESPRPLLKWRGLARGRDGG
jgi:hypothetical protein